MSYAILRIAKLRGKGSINGAAAHILRTRETLNADPRRSIEVIVDKRANQGSIADAVDVAIGSRKTRIDSVKAVEVMLTASPEFFRPDSSTGGQWDAKRLQAWRKAVEPWIKDNFPHAVLVACHLDEQTPHYSIIDVPIDANDRMSCKNKYGGNSRQDIGRWQTAFSDAVKHLGLKRGIEGSKAKHTDIKAFYAQVNKALPKIPEVKTPAPESLPPATMSERLPGTAAYKKRQALEAKHAQQTKKRADEMAARRKAILESHKTMASHAQVADIKAREAKQAQATSEKLSAELKAHRDMLRAMPLDQVMSRVYGAKKTPKSGKTSQEWQLVNGTQVGITEDKWIVQQTQEGGKGAINLVMKLSDVGFQDAVMLLSEHFTTKAIGQEHANQVIAEAHQTIEKVIASAPQEAPKPNPEKWPKVKQWLKAARGLPEALLDALQGLGLIYADDRSNAVFVRSGGGAFIRSSSQHTIFKRTIGSKEAGPFWIREEGAKEVYLVEGPVDALAMKAMHPQASVMAIGGNLLKPADVLSLAKKAHPKADIYAAFDNDAQGDALAKDYPGTTRHKPPGKAKDWADYLRTNPTKTDPAWNSPEASKHTPKVSNRPRI